jgi:hypothetical protein
LCCLTLKLAQHLLGALKDLVGHSGQAGHMNAVAPVGAAGDDVAKEDDAVWPLVDQRVVVADIATSRHNDNGAERHQQYDELES